MIHKLLAFLVIITIFLGYYPSISPAQDDKITFSEINQTLNLPVTSVEMDYYRDGGTIGVAVHNSHGQLLEFCLDGRVITNTPQRIFLGVKHPTSDGAVFDGKRK